ncbi:nucleoporin complex subunit 54-domain-containing protein [Xylariaceae sp. FL1272]|nr:nucleoporin complex subunit 54-domain-containing protein [Xylariaceae sp. FL1272]
MSLFGNKPSAPSAFGNSSLFGQPANNNTPTNPTSSFFGQPSTQTQTQNQTQPQTSAWGGSLIGQPAAQQQPQTNAFGGSLLGQSTAQQQQPQLGASFLGASQNQAALHNKSSIWEPGRESLSHKPVTEQMEQMISKWSPGHSNTMFKYYFYNKVDQSRVPFYQPSPGEDPREWEQAVHDKPAPGYMPALATGFGAVSDRLKVQKGVLSNFQQALHAINSSLDAILSQQDLQTSVRAVNARRKHAILRQRCLTLATKVQVLRNRGYSLDKDEDELKTKLESLEQGLLNPALSARTEELWTRLSLLKDLAGRLRAEVERRGAEAEEGLGEEAEEKAKKILEDYDKQLQTLKGQVETIKKDYVEWQKETNPPSKT